MKPELPNHIRTHNVVHMSTSKLEIRHPSEWQEPLCVPALPLEFDPIGDALYEFADLLAHRRRWRGYNGSRT